MPVPQNAPMQVTPPIQAAPPVQVMPPPAPPAARTPDGGGPDGCQCTVTVEVPIYEGGRIVRYLREQRVTGRSPQCCRK
jgi:hypothetical protein